MHKNICDFFMENYKDLGMQYIFRHCYGTGPRSESLVGIISSAFCLRSYLDH